MKRAVTAFLVKNGLVLVVPGPEGYRLPGGMCEQETIEEGCVRILKEETGLDAFRPVAIFSKILDGKKLFHVTYYCQYKGELAASAKWVDPKTLPLESYTKELFAAIGYN